MEFVPLCLQLIIITKTSSGLNYGKYMNVNRYQLKQIEGSMDPTTDPCENFYQYACGNWDNVHTDVSKYHDHYGMIEYYTNKEMAKLLASDKKTVMVTEEPKFVTTVRAYYKSCVALEKQRLMEYLKWLEDNEHINMMLTESQMKNSSVDLNWVKHLATMNKYGLRGIFLEEEYFENNGTLELNWPLRDEAFKKLTLGQFGILTRTTFFVTNITGFSVKWADVSIFENNLMKLQVLANGNNRTFTMSNLSELPWLYRYVNMLLQNTQFPDQTNGPKIFVKDIDYVKQLYDFLQQYNQQFLCEYLKIRFLWHLLLTSYTTNITPKSCALKARKYMYLATDYLFERQHVDLVESIPKINTMFSNIKHHYSKILLANPNGFNSTVMEFLLHKLNSTKLMVGLLPRINTQQTLEDLYRNLNINESTSNSFYYNQMQMLKYKANSTHLMRIQTAEEPSKYFEHTKRLSPYYIRKWNIVVLPITTLQLPIYDANLAAFFTYSSLGYVLGHELTHGFDTVGTKRGFNGQVLDVYHEMINSNPKFQQNLRCLLRLNNSGIDEKISDITGLRVAYQTYFDLQPNARLTAVKVNGMNLTLSKVFFLNYAQFRCTSSKDIPFQDISHGTHEDRIVDALSHFPEFIKDFECSTNTGMHVLKTCQLWRK